MADLNIKPDLVLRTEIENRLSSSNIDENILTLESLSLATTNSLKYLSSGPAEISLTNLPTIPDSYFSARIIPSFAFPPFTNGCNFVFTFSPYDYGYFAASSSTNLYWSILEDDPSNKILSISQISSSADVKFPSYNYWEFTINNFSSTYSTVLIGTYSQQQLVKWTANVRKIMGPTFSDFVADKLYSVSYRSSGGTSSGGASGSIGGTIEGQDGQIFTYFNNEPISNKLYLGDLTYPLPIGVTGGSGFGGTNSIVTVGGEGMLVNRMYLGDLTYPLPIGVTGGSGFGGTNSVVDIGGEGISSKNIFLGNDTIPGRVRFGAGGTTSGPVDVIYEGNNCINCEGQYCKCWTRFFNPIRRRCKRCPCNGQGGSNGCNDENQRPSGPIGGAANDIRNDVTESMLDYIDVRSGNYSNINVGSVLLGYTQSDLVGMMVVPRYSQTLESHQPDLMLYVGRGFTTSHSREEYEVGLGIYNVATSYLEITSVTYSSPTSSTYKPPILLSANYGQIGGSSFSNLQISSDAVSVNKLYFGDIINEQSLRVSDGELYVNDSIFSSITTMGQTIYEYTNESSKTITHNLGLYPSVQVLDSDDNVLIPTTINFVSENELVVNFSENSTGKIVIGSGMTGSVVGTSIPVSSSSPGRRGEIRVDDGEHLYIHTGAQWLKSSMTFSTF
jgi:hypothetical protein